jgi:hypothetical protein
MQAVIINEKVIAIGNEVSDNGNDNVRVVKSNGEVVGMSAKNPLIIETDLPEDTKVSDYIYNTETETIELKPKTFYTKNDFIDLFSGAEWRAFTQAVDTDDNVNKFYSQILVVEWIELTDVRIQQAMGYLVQIGVITQERFNEMFEPVGVSL